MCNGATQNLFKEMQKEDEVARVNKIRNMIESMVFEKHKKYRIIKLIYQIL